MLVFYDWCQYADFLHDSLLFHIRIFPIKSVPVHGTLFITDEPKPAHNFSYISLPLEFYLSIIWYGFWEMSNDMHSLLYQIEYIFYPAAHFYSFSSCAFSLQISDTNLFTVMIILLLHESNHIVCGTFQADVLHLIVCTLIATVYFSLLSALNNSPCLDRPQNS